MEVYQNKIVREKNDTIEITLKEGKTALVCLNGFQNSDTHDATSMMEYFNENFRSDYPSCEIIPVHLFYPAEKDTHSKKYFEKQIDTKLKELIKEDYNIILLGYSFSASLASKMAYKYRTHIMKLVLVAPVYDTVVNGMIPHYIKYAWKFHKLSKKYGKRAANTIGRKTTKGLPGLLIAIFHSVLADRHYFRKVTTDTLIIRGFDDILCTEHSLRKVDKKIKGEHMSYQYPKMSHGIMKSIKENGAVYDDILHFAFSTPRLYDDTKVKLETKVRIIEKYDEDGNRIPTFNEIFNQLDPNAAEEDRQDQDAY